MITCAGREQLRFGGTNASVIRDEAPITPRVYRRTARARILPVGAKRRRSGTGAPLHNHYATQEQLLLSVLKRRRRTRKSRTACVTCENARTTAGQPSRLARGERGGERDGGPRHANVPTVAPRESFSSPGRASSTGDGSELYKTQRASAHAERCERILRTTLERPCSRCLRGGRGGGAARRGGLPQPALFALEYALPSWRAWGRA